MTDYDIDDEIRSLLKESDEPVKESEIVDAVSPHPKNHATYALVLMRLQSLSNRNEIYSPTPEREWSDV